MIPRPRLLKRRLFLTCFVLACCASAAGQTTAPRETVESVLKALKGAGVEVIYSSELVPPGLLAPPLRDGESPMQHARDALAVHGLALRTVGPNTFVVIREPVQTPAVDTETPLEEISVYASRYAIDGGLAEPHEVSPTDIERVPGSHDDSLRALHSLPGIATNASARPYIRGSLSEDVLVRYDGIGLLDPFHFKNFQSLVSAIDPAGIERIEVFSGGFPVRYGTRSGGVIDITPPNYQSGYEYRANLSLISAGVSTIGKAEKWPIEWLGAIRNSMLDAIDPVEDGFGKPEFSDSLGRLRWVTEQGAWTLGWLLLDDRLELGAQDDEEQATARYRDEYIWLARDQKLSDSLSMRASIVSTSADRDREGTLQSPGVASGELEETRKFSGVELSNDWTFVDNDRSTYTFGGTVAFTRADYRYARQSEFSPEIAAAFDRGLTENVQMLANPKVVSFSLYGANRRKWSRFEAEFGLRVDGQHYEDFGDHTQVSPRFNLRYDFNDQWRLYGSAGRFTQAQHVEEWRVEEAQQVPDSAQVSIHTILGLEHDTAGGMRLGLEAYTKRWTTSAPYFDNQLDPFSLLPDLTPDRIRVDPNVSEASGLEASVRKSFSDSLTGWGTLALSRVADELPAGDVARSWDQPLSVNAGLAWKSSRAGFSVLAGWHTGWPRTPFDLEPLQLHGRNTRSWSDFFSLDLRGSWNWDFESGDLSAVVDLTNATNRRNECCVVLEPSDSSVLDAEVDSWLPALINIGFTYRWRSHR